MRVCLVTPYTPKEISGVGQVVASLAKGLIEKKHNPMILTKSSKEDSPDIQGLVEIEYKDIRFIGGLLLIVRAMFRILREREGIDIIHLHSVSWLAVTCALLGCVLGIPRVLTLHGRFPALSNKFMNAIFNLEERLVIRMSSKTTCVSQDTKDFYELDSAVVVLNGVDISRYHPDQDERRKRREDLKLGESFVLLFLGRWVAHKGIYDLIRVTRNLLRKEIDLKLLLVGSGEEERVKEAIKRNSLQENVVLVGRVEDVAPFYQCSDLYVLYTSPLEGLPLTILEAMACGLPCVATSVSGITEAITNEKDGFLVEQGDVEALERRILACFGDRKNLKEVSRRARETIEKEFTLMKMTEDYLRVYASILRD